jgi:hypothetical protein
MSDQQYEENHIKDVVIEDESSGSKGLDVSVYVSSNDEVILHLGKSMMIRTDENGALELREILHEALEELGRIQYEKMCDRMDEMSEKLNPVWGPVRDVEINEQLNKRSRERSEQQQVDPFDSKLPNDPADW